MFSVCSCRRKLAWSERNAGGALYRVFFARCVPLCFTDVCMISLARLRPVRGRRTRIKFVSGLTGLNEAFHHSWYQSEVRVNIKELGNYI
ncbi:hypothetical protein Taro_027068, partial [Colocasia esculenta]|nr:hypothetical protein [Colocasia esculenta]